MPSIGPGGVAANVAFVARNAFTASRGAAVTYLLLTAALAVLPAAQVTASAALIRRLRVGVDATELMLPVAVVVAAVALAAPLAGACAALGERVMLQTELRLQSRLARTVAAIPPSQFVDPAVSAEVEGHTNAIVDVVSHVYTQAVAGLGAALSAVGVVITVAFMSPLAAILVMLAVVPVVVSGRYISAAVKRSMDVIWPLYQRDRYLRDTMVRQRSATELASLGTADRVAEMVIAQQQKVVDAREIPVRARLRSQGLIAASGLVLLGAAVVAIIVGQQFGADAVAGVYGVIAAMTAVGIGSVALAELLQFLPQTTAVRAFFTRMASSAPQPALLITERASELRIDGLSHRYTGRDTAALSDVSLVVQRGEMVALVGINGAGKTTTVHAALGLIEPTGGTVTVDGRTRAELGEARWLGQFGLLTQEFGRYEFTVREAIALGRPTPATDEEIWHALDAAHAGDLVRAMPNGLDTQLGEQFGGVGVSGGQWQRLALARIQLRDAPIWILDEPTSAIDAEAEAEVFAELGQSRKDRITIVVSHRAWTLRTMDRIYLLEDGQILEVGSYPDLIARHGRFAAIFAEQTEGTPVATKMP